MRGHPYCLSCSLRIHSIFRAVRLCLLGRLAPRPAPRAAVRSVIPPSRLSCRVACCSSPSPASPARSPPLLLASHGFPIVMALSYRRPPRVPSLPAHRPADRVEGRGGHRLAYRCHVRRRRVASLLLSCGAFLPAWCAVPFLSKDFPRQSFKTFLGNVLKTFPDNLLETAKHTPSYMSRPAFLRLRRSVSPPAVSLFSPSRLCFELIKTARFSDSVPPRSAPRSPSRHASCPPSATYPHQAVLFPLIAIRLGSPTLLAHRAASL